MFSHFRLLTVVASVLGASATPSSETDELALMLIQASARIRKPNPLVPRMFVTLGCDGSTALLDHAYPILAMHGIDAGDVATQKELLDPQRNPFMDKTNDVVVAMKYLADEHLQANTTLVFKSILGRDTEATLDKRLLHMGTLAVYNERRNVLDKLICMVRDCFVDTNPSTTPYGYPVDANGNPSDLCFNRRDEDTDDDHYKALLKASDLEANLKWLIAKDKDGAKMLRTAGYHPATVVYEDLVAFEENVNDVPTSVKAWSALLKSWGVEPSPIKLTDYLLAEAGKYEPALTHEVLYNAEEIELELARIGREDLFRKA